MIVKEAGCCKPFNPVKWQGKTIVLKDKLFVKDRVMSFFHIPLNFSAVMKKNMDLIFKSKAGAAEPLMMVDECSPFWSDVYIAVSKEVPGAKMTKLSGTFLSKVYEGNYNQMGKWVADIKEQVKKKGKLMKKLYYFYTTCPACAKAYGHNYTVLLAQV